MGRTKRIADDDIPEMTEADFARAKPMREVMPQVVDTMKRGRGRPKSPSPKARVSLRLDREVVAAYKATGEGWQTRINDTLAHAVGLRRTKPRRKAEKRA
jgi:uncharacterized protein (DUF4415 family)